jgi:hypothetical protein
MIDWIKTIQGIAAIVAVIFATVVAWWNLGLPRLVFSPELPPVHRRIEVARAIRPGHRLLVLDQTLVECQSAGDALAGGGCGVRDVAVRRPADRPRQPVVVIAAARFERW